MADITGPEFSVSIGADLSGLANDFAQIGPIIEGATANLQASMAPLAAGTANASGAFKSFSDAMLALAKAQVDQAGALADLSRAMGTFGAAARGTTAPLNDETSALGNLGTALEGTATTSKAAGVALADTGRGAMQAGTALGQVGQQASTSLVKAAGAAANTAAAVTDLSTSAAKLGTIGGSATAGLQNNLSSIGDAANDARAPLKEVQTDLAGLGVEAASLGEGGESPLAPLADGAENAWAGLDKVKEELGLVNREAKKVSAQGELFADDFVNPDAPDTLGQLSLGYQEVADAADQVRDPVDSANEALERTEGSAGKARGGLRGFVDAMQVHRREQVQNARQSRWWAGEMLSFLPAAAQAKQGLAGLIGIFIQGATGGLGFGLALEAVKVGINVVSEAMTRASKAANELKSEMRMAQVELQFAARALAESFGPALSKTEQLIKEKVTGYQKKIAEAQEQIQKSADESAWKKFWDKWTPGDDHEQRVKRYGNVVQAYQKAITTAPSEGEVLEAGRKEARRAAEDATREALTLEAQRGSRTKAIRQETQNKLTEFDRALPNQWGQILTQMRGLAKLGVNVPITTDWTKAAAALRKGPLSQMSMVDFKVNWTALQASMQKRGEIEKTGARQVSDVRRADDLAYEQARVRHQMAFADERKRIELQGQSEELALNAELTTARLAGDRLAIDRIKERITWADKENKEKLRQFDEQLRVETQVAELGQEGANTDAYTRIETERLAKRTELQSKLTEELRKTNGVETARTRLLREQMAWANENAQKQSDALSAQETLQARVAAQQHDLTMQEINESARAAEASLDQSKAGMAADLDRERIVADAERERWSLESRLNDERLRMTQAERDAAKQRIKDIDEETAARLRAHDAERAARIAAFEQAGGKTDIADTIRQAEAQRDAQLQIAREAAALKREQQDQLDAEMSSMGLAVTKDMADRRVAIEQELQARIAAINERADIAIWEAKNPRAMQFINSLQSTWTSGLARVFEGTLSFKDAINGIWGTIRSSFAQVAAGMLMDWMKTQAMRLIITKGTVVKEVAIEAWGAISKVAIAVGSGIKTIAIKAYEAAAGAYAAIAGIPIVGPVLAPAMAAAALAGVIALASRISAAGGYDIPAGVNPMIQAHQEEMVLPAKLANPLRKMLAKQGEGEGEGFGGGNTTVNVSLSGIDGPSIMRMMRSNDGKSALTAAIVEAQREGRFRKG